MAYHMKLGKAEPRQDVGDTGGERSSGVIMDAVGRHVHWT